MSSLVQPWGDEVQTADCRLQLRWEEGVSPKRAGARPATLQLPPLRHLQHSPLGSSCPVAPWPQIPNIVSVLYVAHLTCCCLRTSDCSPRHRYCTFYLPQPPPQRLHREPIFRHHACILGRSRGMRLKQTHIHAPPRRPALRVPDTYVQLPAVWEEAAEHCSPQHQSPVLLSP
jgi:hypothetical protein